MLYGAELSFAHQNAKDFVLEKKWENLTYSMRRLLAIGIVHTLVQGFSGKKTASTAEEISEYIGAPIKSVKDVISDLVEAGLVSEVKKPGKKGIVYQPGRDPEEITIKTVMDILERRGRKEPSSSLSPVLGKISRKLATLDELIENSEVNVKLKDL